MLMLQHIKGWVKLQCWMQPLKIVKTVMHSPTFLKEPILEMEELKLKPLSFWSPTNLASNTTPLHFPPPIFIKKTTPIPPLL